VLRRVLLVLLVLIVVAAGAVAWAYRSGRLQPFVTDTAETAPADTLVDRLCSQNPRVVEEAEAEVKRLGAAAVPELRATLQNPLAPMDRKKAALRASSLLGVAAAPALPEVAAHVMTVEYTAEAALALSVMGPEAYTPLADALVSNESEVRKEALRSLGKLQQRAPLQPSIVVPHLLDALADRDATVRTIAATYLGILHEDGQAAVPALIEMLKDENPEVRRAAATALGEFGPAAEPALAALRKAQGDKDENVAREAGIAVVKLQAK
jgi:HEAT repeat protein